MGDLHGSNLVAGTNYWLVLRSHDPAGGNGVWLCGHQLAVSTESVGAEWQKVDQASAAPGFTLHGYTALDNDATTASQCKHTGDVCKSNGQCCGKLVCPPAPGTAYDSH